MPWLFFWCRAGSRALTTPPTLFVSAPAAAQFVEKRRQLLEKWLDDLLSLPETVENEDIRGHLQIPEQVLTWVDRFVRARPIPHTP